MSENKGYSVDLINQMILNDDEIVEKIKETMPKKLDENDAESRIKYIDKIESTVNYIENKINNNNSLEEDKKEYLTKILEDKKQELNNCDFKKGTTNIKFKETFEDLCPKLIDKIKEEKNKKDGIEDVSTSAIDKSLILCALNKIVQTRNEELKNKQEEQGKIIFKTIETKQNKGENAEPSLKVTVIKQKEQENEGLNFNIKETEQNKEENTEPSLKVTVIKQKGQENEGLNFNAKETEQQKREKEESEKEIR